MDSQILITVILPILLGIITGVAANLLSTFFINVVMPAYRQYVYKGLSINGDWIIEQDEEPTDKKGLAKQWIMSATLTQKANKITGIATATNIEDNKSASVINYELSGYFYDGLINLSCLRKDNDIIAHSNFLLQVVEDGKKLVGYRSFYGLKSCKVRSAGCKWKKSGHKIIKNLKNELQPANTTEMASVETETKIVERIASVGTKTKQSETPEKITQD